MCGGDRLPDQKVDVKVSIPEIYEVVCPECKKKVKELVKSKIADSIVNPIVEPKP
jgi:uncharacterized alkaline shock family protein YloU